MKLAQFLFKPKWQDKNASVRRAAVAGDTSPDLVAALPEIIRNDVDAGVRLTALKRLDDYEFWRERSTGDSDGEVRRAARAAYLSMLAGKEARVPELPRRIAELDTLSPEELEKVAMQATDRELRGAALSRVSRPALLADRAVVDPDAGLRAAALERVTDVAALERIAERARKTDKTISRLARKRVAAQRIGSGDAAAIALKARLLCERMEALMRASNTTDEAAQAAIERDWATLGDRIPSDLQARYRGAAALVERMRTNAQNPQIAFAAIDAESSLAPTADPDGMILNAAGSALADTASADARPALLSVELLASQARFDAALANAAVESQRERDQRRTHLRELEEVTTQYAVALEAGDVSASHALHDRVLHLNSVSGALPAPLEIRIAPLHARYAELKRWQSWANQQRRQALCAAIEAAAEANMHPDALATRIRASRDEWQKLDASEGSGGNDADLTRRFQALCHQALKPTKTYFNKRDELRRGQSDAIEAVLKSASELPEQISDWKAVGALRLELGKALRSLDAVDPRERTRLGKRIKDAIGVIAPRIHAQIEAVEQAKQRLIDRASALSQQTDGRAVARDARDLQQQWTALGNGKRNVDQRQWTLFRAAVDAAFGKLDAARQERDAQSAAARNFSQTLVEEIEALRDDATHARDAVKVAMRDLDSRWQSQRCEDRSLEQRYRNAHDAIDAGLVVAMRQEHLSRYSRALEKYTLLRSVESGAQTHAAIEKHWQEAKLDSAAFSAALDARYAQLVSAESVVQEDDEQVRDRLVELEFIAGIDTPADDRQRRMNYQVQRLAKRMRERASASPEEELTRVLVAWFKQRAQAEELEARFAQAARAGIAALP
jgi:DNA repair protein SbcC/Rad50